MTHLLGEVPLADLSHRLKAGGVRLDIGVARVCVRSDVAAFVAPFRDAYRHCELLAPGFADVHVAVRRPVGLRRHIRPQALFMVDGKIPFEPFPAANAFPLFEWGVNWCLGNLVNHHLLFHAGALALDGKGVLLAATPGSGKSTLTSAMALSGFRYLSDEFGAVALSDHLLRAVLKPAALKNASIDVIRGLHGSDARVGRIFRGTRKGDVAHLFADRAATLQRHDPVPVRLVVFPRYQAGAPLTVEEVPPSRSFLRLAFNSFNYSLLGPAGFDAVAAIVAGSRAVEISYGALAPAIDVIRERLGATSH